MTVIKELQRVAGEEFSAAAPAPSRPARDSAANPPEWRVSDGPVAYPDAVRAMEERVERIAAGEAPELVWLLEHPPLYTAGTSADEHDLLEPDRFPVYRTGRGGQYTYHGTEIGRASCRESGCQSV